MKRYILGIFIILTLLSGCSNKMKKEVIASTPLDKHIHITINMTYVEITKLLGDNYTLTTEKDECCGNYRSSLTYEDIYFAFKHYSINCPQDINPSTILTTSDKYIFGDNIQVGSSTLKTLSECEKKYKNYYNEFDKKHHFDIFYLSENQEDVEKSKEEFILRFEYTGDKIYDSKTEIDEDSKIELIHIFTIKELNSEG